MTDHKSIAKNTIFLYFRMFLTMGVGLYTSRLVLEALGVVDYGIYGLVGGIVSMFAFLNSAMASSTQRYLSFDLGKNDIERLSKTFNATLNIHFLVAIIVLILAETFGLWFVNNKLVIPEDRMYAVNWVYQFSIFSVLFTIIQVPYNALLIAREHMSVYAYVSIFESILKLLIVLILVKVGSDKLILYSILTLCVSIVVRTVYRIYCKRHFKESRYQFYYEKSYYKELLSYSGWNLFGHVALITRGQGSNILLNLFYGPIANTAYTLTVMVQSVIGAFVSNFQTALNPQITKNYAKGNVNTSINLMFKSSKYSFFAMFILIVPFFYNIDYVMHLWLGDVPPYAMEFIKLALICSLIETLSNPLAVGAQATGKIKWYQITIGGIIFLTLPITLLIFNLYSSPVNIYYVIMGSSITSLIFRVLFLKTLIGLDIYSYLRKTVKPILQVTLVVIVLYNYGKINFLISNIPFLTFIIETVLIVIVIGFVILLLGMERDERLYLQYFLKKQLKKGSNFSK